MLTNGGGAVSDLPVPSGLNTRAVAYWHAVTSAFQFNADELELLVEACRVLSLVDDLAALVDQEGPLVEGRYGPKPHPAVAMLRAERTLLSKLIAQLALPDPETGDVVRSGVSFRGQAGASTRWKKERRSA